VNLGDFIGLHVSGFLEAEPFMHWAFERTVEPDIDEYVVQYVFDGHGLGLLCDKDEHVKVIFLHSEQYGGFDSSLSGIPFSLRRGDARSRYGIPSAQGAGMRDPILGDYGPWERFDREGFVLHLEYTLDGTALKMVTLMALDAVP